MRSLTTAYMASLACLAALAFPRAAAACGGLFCNRPTGPSDLPVAQTAENVLFAMDRNAQGFYRLEAHIQIFYTARTPSSPGWSPSSPPTR